MLLELIERTDRRILLFLDQKAKSKLGVNKKALERALKLKVEPVKDDLEAVLKVHEDISRTQGSNSRERKDNLLASIILSYPEHYELMESYYTKGYSGLGFGQKSFLKLLTRGAQDLRQGTLYDSEAERCYPMLASTYEEKSLKPKLYALEAKLDGVRLIIAIKAGVLELYSRKGLVFPEALKENLKSVLDPLLSLNQDMVVDGELWVPGLTRKGVAFQKVSGLVRSKARIDASEVVLAPFDLISLNGQSLVEKPYIFRRGCLEELCRLVRLEPVALAGYYSGPHLSKDLLKTMVRPDWEGLVIKDTESRYLFNYRGKEWLKFKALGENFDLIVLSSREGTGRKKGKMSSFLCGVNTDKGVYPLAEVGSGFKDQELDQLQKALDKGLKPIIEVKAEALTSSPKYPLGLSLRFPIFVRFRWDKVQPDHIDRLKDYFTPTSSTNSF